MAETMVHYDYVERDLGGSFPVKQSAPAAVTVANVLRDATNNIHDKTGIPKDHLGLYRVPPTSGKSVGQWAAASMLHGDSPPVLYMTTKEEFAGHGMLGSMDHMRKRDEVITKILADMRSDMDKKFAELKAQADGSDKKHAEANKKLAQDVDALQGDVKRLKAFAGELGRIAFPSARWFEDED